MSDATIPTIFFLIFIGLLFGFYIFLQWKMDQRAKCYRLITQHQLQQHFILPNQQEDVYNISARVQGQGAWPTHEGHVSLDHFAIANETNKYGDAPPSYEEAVRIAPHPVLEANPSSLISVTTVPKPAATPPPASTH